METDVSVAIHFTGEGLPKKNSLAKFLQVQGKKCVYLKCGSWRKDLSDLCIYQDNLSNFFIESLEKFRLL